jgi:hypothetical protein
VVIDARPFFENYVRVTGVQLFNGLNGAGRPAIVSWSKVSGVTLSGSIDLQRAHRGFGPTFVIDNGPNRDNGAPFITVSVSVTFPKRATRYKGRKTWLFEGPRACHGSWHWQQVNTTYAGARLIADDRSPCVNR